VYLASTLLQLHLVDQCGSLVALASRIRMSPSEQAAYTRALLKEIGGDTSKVAMSYSTVNRSRRETGLKIAQGYKESWVAPKLVTIHWDSKLLPSLNNQNVLEERLTVVVGTADESKLLGVPPYKPGTDRKSGEIIAKLTAGLLNEWACSNAIVNMAFDTTSSNTGHVTGACISIQQQLGRPLLWSGCRHHIGEVVVTHVFDDLKIEPSRAPTVTLFTRFKKNVALMPSSSGQQPLARLDGNHFEEPAKSIVKMPSIVQSWCNQLQAGLCEG
jgi:hypothetical protein